MATSMRGLGRGLDALLGGIKPEEAQAQAGDVRRIPLANIRPNPHQPRKDFSAEALQDLAASIKSQGVLQPVLVRPLPDGEDTFELVAGERRLRASQLAGIEDIPALVRELSDQESLAIALIENLQREDLNAMEEAEGYRQLMQQFDLSQEALAEKVGKSRSTLSNALRLLSLPSAVQEDIRQGRMTAGHGRAVMAVNDGDAASELHRRIVALGLSVRQAEDQAAHFKEHGQLPVEEPAGGGQAAPLFGGKRKGGRQPKDASVKALEKRLRKALGLKVRLMGALDSGKLTFAYEGRDKLAELTRLLGVDLDEIG